MIQDLRELFPSLIESDQPFDLENLQWFTNEQNQIIGIAKEEISERDEKILTTFLQPYSFVETVVTDHEKLWKGILFDNQKPDTDFLDESYRFIHFTLAEAPGDPLAFREAILALYPIEVPIVWESSQEGTIVEHGNIPESEYLAYDQIVDVLMSDFSINIRLFVSPYFHAIEKAGEYYEQVKKDCAISRKYQKSSVSTYHEIAPYLFLDSISETQKQYMVQAILGETVNDEELLHTIDVFLSSSSNTSLAAKKLYMHRNSLQYRVDKFMEKTGIDIKQFDGAIIVYLAILMRWTFD
ncbi:helix-turn-helix domain-containing protein [Radiobacillus kanasensis]|uniref:PucR family transcriptional regulator n=1 Tax=Radiobacillus kanasensis TaxID=2844358 RepID=UPI001E335752|nr:helix-turn-helix domain-containing protein [Radiobacillus kanasensis]UFU00466.1 helix-turn-helix domain-containing protein [Radiobacillus kanasensis]